MTFSNFPRLFLFLALWVTTLQKTDAGCPSEEWLPYNEEKCFRVLNLMASQQYSEYICQEQNATLLSIPSAEDQEFFHNLHKLPLPAGVPHDAWLNAVRVNSTTFKWTDGSPWTLDNWKEGSPSDDLTKKCVRMTRQFGRKRNSDYYDPPNIRGLWVDEDCEIRHQIVCQVRPTFTLDELVTLFFQHRRFSETLHRQQEKRLAEAEKKLAKAEGQLKELKTKQVLTEEQLTNVKKNPVPIGFVYTQLPGKPEPSALWPTVKWWQITHLYKGLFFRAEGGNSSTFGQVQNDESPRLRRVVHSDRSDQVDQPRDIFVPERGASDMIFTGSDRRYRGTNNPTDLKYYLSFHNSGGEVRPKNSAIRLWLRSG